MSPLSCILFLSLLAISLAAEGNSRFHSAKCIAYGRRCNDYLQRQSGSCMAGVPARKQSQACYRLACSWCVLPGKLDIFPCNRRIVRRMCRRNKKMMKKAPMPMPVDPKRMPSPEEPEPMATPEDLPSGPRPDGCIYMGGSKAVISLGSVSPKDGWDRVSRGGMSGLIFESGKTHGTVPGGTRGEYCFDVKMAEGGDYYLTALSAAPHPTEHNDCWLSSSLGFKLLREGNFKSAGADTWLKGYQNKGNNEINNVISTEDHNAHAFIVPGVKAGMGFKVCMSGRSFKFEMFKLVLMKCSGTGCSPRNMTPMLGSLTATECM